MVSFTKFFMFEHKSTLDIYNILHIFRYIFYIIGAIAKTSYYTEGWLPHSLYNLNCTGNESILFNCSYETSGVSCGNYDDAGVICQGQLHNN